MLGQAAAMLVSFPAVLAVNLRPVESPPLFGQWLTVTTSPNQRLVGGFVVLGRARFLVVHGTVRVLQVPFDSDQRSLGGHASRRRG